MFYVIVRAKARVALQLTDSLTNLHATLGFTHDPLQRFPRRGMKRCDIPGVPHIKRAQCGRDMGQTCWYKSSLWTRPGLQEHFVVTNREIEMLLYKREK